MLLRLLSILLLVTIATMSSRAAAERPDGEQPLPIDGAFGLVFGEPLPQQVMLPQAQSATTDGLPKDSYFRQLLPVPRRLMRDEPKHFAVMGPGWRAVRPPVEPSLLADLATQYAVLLDDSFRPVRISARARTPLCATRALQVGNVFARKYDVTDKPDADADNETDATRRIATDGSHRAQVLCHNGMLVLDYFDGGRYATWQRRRSSDQKRALAETLLAGSGKHLVGAFGVPFGEPLRVDGVVPDVDAVVGILTAPEAWRDATFTVMVDPDRRPIRISGRKQYSSMAEVAAAKERLAIAFAERFGPLMKDSPKHTVLAVSGDHAVLRSHPDATLSVTVIHGDAFSSHRVRLEQEAQMRARQRQLQLEAETLGL